MALAILAMVFRALLPSGWMPNPAGFGETAFILCDMDGSMSATDMVRMMAAMPGMDMSSMSGDGKKAPVSGHGHEECPFAAATHAGAATANLAITLPVFAVDHAHRAVPERSLIHEAHYKPQSPRAPPQFA
jgi:hypothetical protein